MARHVIWSTEALADIEEIAEFIARDSPVYAALTVSRLIERTEQALEFPHSGRVVPESTKPDVRELFWRDYRVIYEVMPEGVRIVTVIHGRRQLPER